MKKKDWVNHFKNVKEIWIPRNLILIDGDNAVPQFFEKVTIEATYTEQRFTMGNGEKFRPEILYVTTDGEVIGLELSYKKRKADIFRQAYEFIGVESYEIYFTEHDEICDHNITYLYSKKKTPLVEGYWDLKVNQSYFDANNFAKDVYRIIAIWDSYYWYHRTIPRYNFYLIDKKTKERFLFRTTFKTYQKVKKSYGEIFNIYATETLSERIRAEEIKSNPYLRKKAQRDYCIRYETHLNK